MSELVQQHIIVHLADDRELEVTTDNRDLVRWDMTRGKHGWPSMDDAPMLWATFVAWCAAQRTGVYDGKWEDWSTKDCVSVDFDEADVESVDPTRTAPAPSSA